MSAPIRCVHCGQKIRSGNWGTGWRSAAGYFCFVSGTGHERKGKESKAAPPKGQAGRPSNLVAVGYAERFGLSEIKQRKLLGRKMCEQLSFCRTDEARRLLLGVSA